MHILFDSVLTVTRTIRAPHGLFVEEPHRYVAACVEVKSLGLGQCGSNLQKTRMCDCFCVIISNWAGLATDPTAGMMVVFVSAPPWV